MLVLRWTPSVSAVYQGVCTSIAGTHVAVLLDGAPQALPAAGGYYQQQGDCNRK